MERGVEILESALTDDTRFGDAHYQLGIVLFALSRPQDALNPLETSVRLGPDIPERLNTLVHLYEEVGGSPERIEDLYLHALEIQPLNAPIKVNYGRFLETQGQVAEAEGQYEMTIEQRPSLATVNYNLGTLIVAQAVH